MDTPIAPLFDALSPHYERINHILSLGLDRYWRNQLARHVYRNNLKNRSLTASALPHTSCSHVHPALEKTSRVSNATREKLSYQTSSDCFGICKHHPIDLLDVATGGGEQIAALLKRKIAINSAIGVDCSRAMLTRAEETFKGEERVSFVHGDIRTLPFPDHRFDLSTCSFGIRNVPHPQQVLSELFRVIKPGGRCLFLEFSRPQGMLRTPYRFYLRHLIPFVGGMLSRNRPAYRHLSQSIEAFAAPELFLSWMSEAGWTNLVAQPYTGGIVTLYRGDRAPKLA